MTRHTLLFWPKRADSLFPTPSGAGSWYDQLNAATPLAGLARPPVQLPDMSRGTPVPPPRTTRPMGPVASGAPVSFIPPAAKPSRTGIWASPGLGGPTSDSFHSRSGITTEHPVFSAANFGDTSRMTDDQKTQWANVNAGRGFHSDWSAMRRRDNSNGMDTDFSRTRELQGGLAPDPRTGKLVDAGTSTIGQVTQHDSVNGAAHPAIDGPKTYMSIDTPYGKGTTAEVGSKAHEAWRGGTSQPKLNPGGKSLTDNGVTTTSQGAGAFQAQLNPMQQAQAQKFVQDQKMNNPAAFGSQLPPSYGSMSNASKQEYWNNVPKAPYNDGLPEHPALKLPQSVQNGAANLTQSNLPAVAPQAPGAGLAKPPPAMAAKPGAPAAGAPPSPLPPPPGVASTNTAVNNPVPPPAAPPAAGAPATPGAPVAATAPKPATPPAAAGAPPPAAAPKAGPPSLPNANAKTDWRTPPLHTSNDWRTHTSTPAPPVAPAALPPPAWTGRAVPTEAAGMGGINPNLLPGIDAAPKSPPVGLSILPAMHPIA